MAEAIAPGRRAPDRSASGPGEKLHEVLADRGRVAPLARDWRPLRDPARVRILAAARGRGRHAACRTASATRATPTTDWLDVDELREMAAGVERPWRDATASSRTAARRSRDEDVEAVVAALRAELITQGPTIERFEEALAEYLGAAHAVAFSNGTAALHGAAFAAGLGAGRRGDHHADHLRGVRQLRALPGRAPALRRHRPGDLEPRHRGGRRAASVSGRGRSSPVSFAGLPVDLEPLQACATASS